MPTRNLDIEGTSWRVFPSGFVTPNEHDEFALIFVTGSGEDRDVRVTRYSPHGTRSREQSLAELPDAELRRLFGESQAGSTSPEAGYSS
ncbi:MAG: hypothetical protein IPF98_17350 [Gemmatimonadetes bacterium]|nr:hypothetical protein [Gemmatimonadota bacterium]MCC6774589.1 hypothetical protein [Gemmatimonadaceae bacterium]